MCLVKEVIVVFVFRPRLVRGVVDVFLRVRGRVSSVVPDMDKGGGK
jgi:hypothetical protein